MPSSIRKRKDTGLMGPPDVSTFGPICRGESPACVQGEGRGGLWGWGPGEMGWGGAAADAPSTMSPGPPLPSVLHRMTSPQVLFHPLASHWHDITQGQVRCSSP